MLVSCLMISSGSRRAQMIAAAHAYARQSHLCRELIVVIAGGTKIERDQAEAGLREIELAGLRVHSLPDDRPLGALRNISVHLASGDLLCQWDDDDLYHPDRIAGQLAALNASGKAVTILQDVMLLDSRRGELRWLNWAATPLGGHPGTLLCRRQAMRSYPEHGDYAALGEDRVLLEGLRDSGLVHVQPGAPHLYVYVAHGANSYGSEHHEMLARELSISAGLLRRREAELRRGLAALDLGKGALSVHGRDGIGFILP